MKAARKNSIEELKKFLDEKADQFNQPNFIAFDPISIPHQFKKKQDIEIGSNAIKLG